LKPTFFFYSFVCATLLIVLTAGVTRGQVHKGIIHVTDNKSNEPVAFANVCFEGLKTGFKKYGLTSIEGKASNEAREVSAIIVSYVGYTTFRDTIHPGQSLEIKLEPSVLNMDEVVVTAQYSPEKADKSIYRVEVINSRQIEMKGATNMADLLKDQSAMHVTQRGTLGTTLQIQGLTGENIKFLTDGIPMVGRLNGNFDLNQINLNNTDHVEVIEGPMSVIYGSNAIGGVINIITRENKTSLLNTSVNAYYESVGVYNFDASVSIGGKKHGFSIDAARDFFGGYAYDNTSRIQDFKPKRQYLADGYYAYHSKKIKLKLAGDYFNELLLDKGDYTDRYGETATDNEYKTIRYTGRMDAAIILPRMHFINILASYSSYERYMQAYAKDFTVPNSIPLNNPDGQDTTGIQSYTARATFAKNNPEKKFNYQAGGDLNVEGGEGKRILNKYQQIGDYAAFLSLSWNPVKVLSLQPGARFIYNTKYKAPLVYAFSAKWSLTNELNLRCSYARGFRSPDIKELYLEFKDVIHDVQGNDSLKAEKSHNFNLNLKYNKEKTKVAWSGELSGFFNMVSNQIVLVQVHDITYKYFNVQKYRTLGFTGAAAFSLYPQLQFTAGISETGVSGSASGNDKLSSFDYGTDVTVTGSYHFLKPELTLSLFYKYSGKNPIFQVTDSNKVQIGHLYPYHSMDFTIAKGFYRNWIRLSMGVKNIFDVKIVQKTGIAGAAHEGSTEGENVGWGRTYFLKLSFNLDKYK